MSKFKLGDKVKLKAEAGHWGDNHLELKKKVFTVGDQLLSGDGTDSILECVSYYPDDWEIVVPVPEKHIHYDMIISWAANPSRVVQWRDNKDCTWQNCSEDSQHPFPVWDEDVQYRFKPEEPERVFPETSLSLEELVMIWDNSPAGLSVTLKAVANEAIKRYVMEQDKL